MKRIFACITALMCCVGFAACGEKEDTVPHEAASVTAEKTAEATAKKTETSVKAAETTAPSETQPQEAPLPELSPEEKNALDSLQTLTDNVYSMDFRTDYMLEDHLKANIRSADEFDAWLTENITGGVPTGRSKAPSGCSSFAAVNADEHHIFGRNYDEIGECSMVVRTFPKEGYASIGIADLSHINIGERCDHMIGDEAAKHLLMAAPWDICDGVNEKGLGVSVLSLNEEHIVNDTEKGDLLIYAMTRVLLDKCANVDEALGLLAEYDAYSPGRHTYHLFIADKSGRSVVVEWLEGNMYTIEDNAVTNFVLHDNPTYSGDYDARYYRLRHKLDEDQPFSDETAMELLLNVSQPSYTQWSALYDLDDFSLSVCFKRDGSKSFSFSGKE